jgi:tRNA nucleotidyltransferase (CCA-adding enzyme)
MTEAAQKVLSEVLEKITPTEAQRNEKRKITNMVLEAARKVLPPHVGVTLAGSYTRDTWLLDKREFDLFMLFPESTSRRDLETEGIEIGRKIVRAAGGTHEIAYAEHPYVRAKIKGFDVDIVPCYKVGSAAKIKSAVDRTPFHNTYVSEHLNPKLSGEVRLLKTFAKAQGFYGSDNKTLALSGYLCELMIIKYGSFMHFCDAASRWEPGMIEIDIKHHRPAGLKFDRHPLVVIDPVDPKRNVGAVVSPANFTLIVKSCREFLGSPSALFFEKRKPSASGAKISAAFRERATNPVVIVFSRPAYVDDIIWPQMRKTARRLVDILKEYEFGIIGHDVWADEKECAILIECAEFCLPNVRIIHGPPVFAIRNRDQFITKYRKAGRLWVEDNIWSAEVRRKFTRPEHKIKDTLSDPLEELKEKGIASHMAEAAAKGFKLMAGNDVYAFASKSVEFSVFLRKYLEKTHI